MCVVFNLCNFKPNISINRHDLRIDESRKNLPFFVYIYIYKHMYIYTYKHTHTHIYIHIYMCVYVYMYLYIGKIFLDSSILESCLFIEIFGI